MIGESPAVAPEPAAPTTEEERRLADLQNSLKFLTGNKDEYNYYPPVWQERIKVLLEHSRINEYDLRVAFYIKQLLDDDLFNELSEDEKENLVKAGFLHDLGKSGPADASAEQMGAITRLFAIDNLIVKDYEPKRVGEATLKILHDQRQITDEDYKALLLLPHFNEQTTMREFWNAHSRWSNEVIWFDPNNAPFVSRPIAVHHLLDGVDPREFASDKDKISMPTAGQEWDLAQNECLLMLVDKYEAFRTRGGKDHSAAIDYLNGRLKALTNADGQITMTNGQSVKLSNSALENLRQTLSLLENEEPAFPFPVSDKSINKQEVKAAQV